ncbi:MAG: hypothetical protein CL911_07760 [Deltaproteobacteria bacterium]|nr:hypothetical protein [Deltaproteobacteria bacterium]
MKVTESIEMVRVILDAAKAGPLASLDWQWDEGKSHSENLHDFISIIIVELDGLEDQRAKLLEALERSRSDR